MSREIDGFFEDLSAKIEQATWEGAYLTVYGLGDVEKNLGRIDLTVEAATAWLAENETADRDRLLPAMEDRQGGVDEIDEDAVAAVLDVAKLFVLQEIRGWARVRLRVRANGGEDVLGRTITLATNNSNLVLQPREPVADLRAVIARPPAQEQPERATELVLHSTGRILDLVIRERESDGDYLRANFREVLDAKQGVVEDLRRQIAELRRDAHMLNKRLADAERAHRAREDGHVDKVLERRADDREAEADKLLAKAMSETFSRTLDKGTALGSLYLMKDMDVAKMPFIQKILSNPNLLEVMGNPAIISLLENPLVVETLTKPHILALLNHPAFAALCTEERIPALIASFEAMAANNPATPE